MDWLQFTATIVGHIAWPSVLIVLFIILRKHMGALADRMLEFNFGGAKILFGKVLEEGAKIIEQEQGAEIPKSEPELKLEAPVQQAKVPTPLERYHSQHVLKAETGVYRLEGGNAALRVVSALDEADKLLFDIGDTIGVDAASPLGVMHALINRELLGRHIVDLYRTLQEARSVVTHTQALPDWRDAGEFIRQVDFLKGTLTQVLQKIDREKEKSPS